MLRGPLAFPGISAVLGGIFLNIMTPDCSALQALSVQSCEIGVSFALSAHHAWSLRRRQSPPKSSGEFVISVAKHMSMTCAHCELVMMRTAPFVQLATFGRR